MPAKRKPNGSRPLGAELRRRRGARTLQEISALSKSPPFSDRVEPIGVSTLYMIEEGQTMPTLRSLHTLASVYRIPVQHLVHLACVDRYGRATPATENVQELRQATLDAFARADHEVAWAAARAWEERASTPESRRAAVNNKASALWKLGHVDEACLLLLDLLSEDAVPARQALVAFTNLAEMFRSKGNLRQGLVQTEAGLALARETEDDLAEAFLLRTRANLKTDRCLLRRIATEATPRLTEREECDVLSALADYEASSTIYHRLDRPIDALFNDVSVGQARCLLNDRSRGREVLERALGAFEARGHDMGEAAALLELGRADLDAGRFEAARRSLWKAERVAVAGGHQELTFSAYYLLMRLEGRLAGNPSFFFKKCQRLHAVLESRGPEVTAFESLLRSAGGVS